MPIQNIDCDLVSVGPQNGQYGRFPTERKRSRILRGLTRHPFGNVEAISVAAWKRFCMYVSLICRFMGRRDGQTSRSGRIGNSLRSVKPSPFSLNCRFCNIEHNRDMSLVSPDCSIPMVRSLCSSLRLCIVKTERICSFRWYYYVYFFVYFVM